MSEPNGGSPIQTAIVVLLLAGGGWYFFNHYQISGLDAVSVAPRGTDATDLSFVGLNDSQLPTSASTAPKPNSIVANFASAWSGHDQSDTSSLREPIDERRADARAGTQRKIATERLSSLRVATWSLDGFGPTKLASQDARRTLCQVIRQFDVIALQQISAIERDLVTRLVDAVNEGDPRYDFVLGNQTGPKDRPEHLAFVFDTTRVEVDRTQTYSLADPSDSVTYDPLVAWFRAAEPSNDAAWTFSLVNVRIDLARAADEVAMLPAMMNAIRNDGRGEDDVVTLGLFQADNAYLSRILAGTAHESTVQNGTTDIFGRYQTSNVIIHRASNSEYVGRSGAFDFLRVFNLSLAEAEVASSYLPVYAEFSPVEGGVR